MLSLSQHQPLTPEELPGKMFSWKLNPNTLSDAQNTSTLNSPLKKLLFHIIGKEQTIIEKTPSLPSFPHPCSTLRHPQRACHRLALPPIIAMRPLGREREAAGEGPPTRKNPCLFKGPVFLWPKKSLPHGFPGLEITCTMSRSHLVWWCWVFFPKSLFLKRKEKGASDVYFCSNSGETAESTCFSFAANSKQLPPGSGQKKGVAGERGTELRSQLPRGNHLELQRNACVSQESLYIS